MIASISKDLISYLSVFPEDAPRLRLLLGQAAHDPKIALRSNMAGHVTSSALLLDHTRERVAMIFHETYQVWIPAGGHLEPDSPTPLLSALRETGEELGVTDIRRTKAFGSMPIDIDTHAISARPRKSEGPHWHHDFMYVGIAPPGAVLTPQLEEVSAARWLDLDAYYALPDARSQRIGERLRRFAEAELG